MKKLVIGYAAVATLLAGMMTGSVAAQANRSCAPREMVVERLASKYGEVRQSMGLGANNVVIEVFASDTSGTWTITVTSVSGLTCLVASGQAYESMVEALPAEGNDA